ncbi:MAG: hypothetical protein ACFE7R_04495 [Candidatus Hodarchaeota archaeon]
MSGNEENAALADLEKKIDKLTEELDAVKSELKGLASIPAIEKNINGFGTDLKEIGKSVKSFETELGKMNKSKDSEIITKKIDGVSDSLKGIESNVSEILDSKEMAVLFKKMDDILVGVTDIGNAINESGSIADMNKKLDNVLNSMNDSDVIGSKIDDLQQYIAGLSNIEGTIQDLSGSLTETNEIVGIIVRQLDDIERKYNASIEKLNEAMEFIKSALVAEAHEEEKKPTKKPGKKAEKKEEPEEEDLAGKPLPTAIEEIMKALLAEVTPQTEAREMATALEDVRDRLTSMISGHTPVLFQFGKRARELKSYPPTATLNENDIASLNTDIRSWTSKLKEIAKGE